MTAFSKYGRADGYDAAAALTKYRFVKLSGTDEEVTPVTAKTDVVVGVAQFDVSAAEILKGKGATVLAEGISEVEVAVGATINSGDLAGLTANGTIRTAASGDRVVGTCLLDAAAGERTSVALAVPGYILP